MYYNYNIYIRIIIFNDAKQLETSKHLMVCEENNFLCIKNIIITNNNKIMSTLEMENP